MTKQLFHNETPHYNAAKRALELFAKALRENTDEAKDCDRAMAIRIYARMATDRSLFENARKCRERAQVRLCELLCEMRAEQRKAKTTSEVT
jgi:NAD(P)-dependent dehydrogenase (short-subunit alcohol dehydrogenase family)